VLSESVFHFLPGVFSLAAFMRAFTSLTNMGIMRMKYGEVRTTSYQCAPGLKRTFSMGISSHVGWSIPFFASYFHVW
jgi:hypothetical protein